MSGFILKEKHLAFCNDFVSGLPSWEAYQKHIARPGSTKRSCLSAVSKFITKKEVRLAIDKIRKTREEHIIQSQARIVAKEFSTKVLTVDEMDCFHSAVAQGLVMVEELVPVYHWEEVLDGEGKIIRREKKVQFMQVKRPPNIKEKQYSISELYKRGSHYPAPRFFGAFKNLDNDDPTADINTERFILLSNGERVPLLTEAKKTGS